MYDIKSITEVEMNIFCKIYISLDTYIYMCVCVCVCVCEDVKLIIFEIFVKHFYC